MPTTSVVGLIGAPREQVWAALSDILNARRWNSAWKEIQFTSNQTHGPGTRFVARTEDGQTFEFIISAWVAPEYIEFSPVRDASERFGIMLESQGFQLLSAGGAATRVELIAQASTHGIKGWLTGLILWRGYQKQGLRYALENLTSIFEPQEQDEPDGEATPADD
jgi:uncharacterized protein YndB with AHSA1/START domain